MKNKTHILVVEDNTFIYHELKEVLLDAGFSVSKYTPSVKDAIANINRKQPDIVLLDIDLKGEHNGIYLGNLLKTEYKIPFFYVTEYDDEFTFNQSSLTLPEDFISKDSINLNDKAIVLSTKPELDEKRLVRTILMILNRQEKSELPVVKEGIWAYVDYPEETKNLGNKDISRVQVLYKDIAYFTTNSEVIDDEKTKDPEFPKYIKMNDNTVRLYTWDKQSFIVNHNLKPVADVLPNYFMRINEAYIVNLNDEMLDGRINGKRIQIRGEVLTISNTYKTEVLKRMENKYQKMEKKKN